MAPVRLEPAALRSRVKHSTTEPLRLLLGKIFTDLSLDTGYHPFYIHIYMSTCSCSYLIQKIGNRLHDTLCSDPEDQPKQ